MQGDANTRPKFKKQEPLASRLAASAVAPIAAARSDMFREQRIEELLRMEEEQRRNLAMDVLQAGSARKTTSIDPSLTFLPGPGTTTELRNPQLGHA